MIRFALMLCTAAVLSMNASTAEAHDPGQIAANCLQRVQMIVDRCSNAAADETQECVRTIDALQDKGRHEAAAEVARNCIQSARQRTRLCIAEIQDICGECIDFLTSIGENELAARVRSNCSDSISNVEGILEREVNAVEAALAD